MDKKVFGKTGLQAGRTAFGCIPIQRITFDESTQLLRHAFDNGVTVYDTATGYTTSEERIGIALGDVRKDIILCTKSMADTPEKLMLNIENSLRMMKTDYIDVYQLHNPNFVPVPGGEDGYYDCLLKAKEQGKIRFIGISQHSREKAVTAVESGYYDVLQYPVSYLSSDEEMALVRRCGELGVAVLAMKGMCGGILSNAKAAFAFLRQYEHVFPIWGVQFMWELDEFLGYEKENPAMDETMLKIIEADKAELSGSFCRACGYCLPCPAGVPIPMAARMSFLLRRMLRENLLSPEWQENMRRIEDCTDCGHCKKNCPYGLDAPELLKTQRKAYFEALNK
jgi:predicted aldo/keto reductase-like oxidoreductase